MNQDRRNVLKTLLVGGAACLAATLLGGRDAEAAEGRVRRRRRRRRVRRVRG